MYFNGKEDGVFSLTSLKMSIGLGVVVLQLGTLGAFEHWPAPPGAHGAKFCLEALNFVPPQGSMHHPHKVSISLVLILVLKGSQSVQDPSAGSQLCLCHV